MTKMTKRLNQLLLAALLATVPMLASAAGDARVDRLTDLVVSAIPLGKVFDHFAKGDPQWPMQDAPDKVTPAQLACMRKELSTPGYRRAKRDEVAKYVARNRGRIERDIEVLDGGAALLMGKLMMAGVEQEMTGVPVDQNALMSEATPEQLSAFMSFMTAPDFAPLRVLAGIGDAFDAGADGEANEQRGEAAGADLATRVMLGGMQRCDVPTSILFN